MTTPTYDRELIARMLEAARRRAMHQFSVETWEGQIAALRTADNADAAGVRTLLAPKLDMIISGYRINQDDADWLRGLLHRASAPPSAPVGVQAVVKAMRLLAGVGIPVKPECVGRWADQLEALAQQPEAPAQG